MLGAILGDIVGSVYEFNNHPSKDFPLFQEDLLFTDDTILTIATADALMTGFDFETKYREYGNKYASSYGNRFQDWIDEVITGPYISFGNGSAMRWKRTWKRVSSYREERFLGTCRIISMHW